MMGVGGRGGGERNILLLGGFFEAETFQLRYCKIEQKRLFCTLSCWETVQVWFETYFPSNLKNKHSQWGGLLQEKIDGGVRSNSQNPYNIYDQAKN